METSYELTKKQKFFVETIQSFASKQLKPLAGEIDNSSSFPGEALNRLAGTRLLGLLVPREEGGEGAGFHDVCLALEGIAKICPTTALVCSVQNIGAWLVMWLGTPEQKKKYLSRLLGGKCLFGFALPEPVFFNFLATPLSFSKKDSPEDGFLINGPDMHVMNGDVADVIMVHAKNDGSPASCFLVERGTQGLLGRITEGMTGAEARYICKVKMENCHIPPGNLLGQEGGAEEILANFISKDCLFTSARALGIAQGALESAIKYSQEREQFGRKISQFHAVQMILGDIGAQVEAARHLVYKAASALDQKSRQAVMLTAMAKYFASNAAMKVAKDALQIFGGYGLMKDYPVEKMMRNAQLTQISQGSLQNQRLAIAKELLR